MDEFSNNKRHNNPTNKKYKRVGEIDANKFIKKKDSHRFDRATVSKRDEYLFEGDEVSF